MSYIDLKYLLLIAPKLERFSDKGNNVYQCRCPICGDSSKSKIKTRGYFFETQRGLSYKCHNCSYSSTFSKFLKDFDDVKYGEYSFEKFKEGKSNREVKIPKVKVESQFKPLDLKPLSVCTGAIKDYAISRGFTEEQLSRAYHCDNYGSWCVEHFGERYAKLKDEPRMVLPFLDISGNLVGAQGRSIDPNCFLRYETAKHPDVDYAIFGLDAWNRTLPTLVCEGPIDSLFLKNGLAVASSDLLRIVKVVPSLVIATTVFIWDNEPRSKEISKLMNACIENGYNIFIWPDEISCKDINDAVNLNYDINLLISENVYSGLSARLRFSQWCKV
jgi:hypothetical protein